jgi:hypothetical protein
MKQRVAQKNKKKLITQINWKFNDIRSSNENNKISLDPLLETCLYLIQVIAPPKLICHCKKYLRICLPPYINHIQWVVHL